MSNRLTETLNTLSSIQLIKENAHLIRPSEASIVDVRDLSIVLLRRQLGLSFKGYNIRKNLDDYAIRIDDEDIAEALMVAKKMYERPEMASKFTEEVYADIQLTTSPLYVLYNSLEELAGIISCQIKTDNRFFIYISIRDRCHYSDSVESFNKFSLNTRLNKIVEISESLQNIIYSENYLKFKNILLENLTTNISRLMFPLTEDFAEYYNNIEPSSRSRNIETVLSEYNSRVVFGEEDEQESEEAPILHVRPVEMQETIEAPSFRLRLIDVADPFAFTLDPVSEIDEEQDEEEYIQIHGEIPYSIDPSLGEFLTRASLITGDYDDSQDFNGSEIDSLFAPLERNEVSASDISTGYIDTSNIITNSVISETRPSAVEATAEEVHPDNITNSDIVEFINTIRMPNIGIPIDYIDFTETEIYDEEPYVCYNVSNRQVSYYILENGIEKVKTTSLLFVQAMFFALYGKKVIEICYRRELPNVN